MDISLTHAPVTLVVMVVTVATSVVSFYKERIREFLALEPYRMFKDGHFHQVVTSGLVHADVPHLMINMLTLYFFGPYLEMLIALSSGSHLPFLGIYLVSLVAGSIYPLLKYRRRDGYVAVGASGAISGLVFAFCLAEPTSLIYIFFAIPIPAWLYAILFTAYSTYAMRRANDNIGHEAHLAGALAGIVATVIAVPGIVTIFQRIGIPFP